MRSPRRRALPAPTLPSYPAPCPGAPRSPAQAPAKAGELPQPLPHRPVRLRYWSQAYLLLSVACASEQTRTDFTDLLTDRLDIEIKPKVADNALRYLTMNGFLAYGEPQRNGVGRPWLTYLLTDAGEAELARLPLRAYA